MDGLSEARVRATGIFWGDTMKQQIPVEKIELDLENPRIKHFLDMYSIQTEEAMRLALGAGADDSGDSYRNLKRSIQASSGIIQSIIVRRIERNS